MAAMKPTFIALWLSASGAPGVSVSAIELTKTGDVLVDAEALMIRGGINGLSFQQDALISHQGYQYVGYYDGKRRVCLARRKQSEESWQVIRFEDYRFTSVDSHNTISVGICPKDGTIHLAFDHHGHPLHYRVSLKRVASQPEKTKWTASLFGRVVSELERGKPIALTYPRFWQTPLGGLQFCYRVRRAGDGDRVLVDYSPKTGNWGGTRQIDSGAGTFKDHWGQSPSRCSYPNGYCFGPDGNLHVTWVWREGKGNANHDLMYSYSEDNGRTWLNNKGEKLSIPHVGSPDITVATIPRGLGVAPLLFNKGKISTIRVDEGSAAVQAQGIVPEAKVVGAFHNISAEDLLIPVKNIDSDVIVCADDESSKSYVMELAEKIEGIRGVDGGALENSRYVEELTALLLNINKVYKAHSSIRITGL